MYHQHTLEKPCQRILPSHRDLLTHPVSQHIPTHQPQKTFPNHQNDSHPTTYVEKEAEGYKPHVHYPKTRGHNSHTCATHVEQSVLTCQNVEARTGHSPHHPKPSHVQLPNKQTKHIGEHPHMPQHEIMC